MTHYSRQLLHLEAVLASKLKQVSGWYLPSCCCEAYHQPTSHLPLTLQVSLLKKEHQLLQHKVSGSGSGHLSRTITRSAAVQPFNTCFSHVHTHCRKRR